MRLPTRLSPVTALRAALAAPPAYRPLTLAAERLIRRALLRSQTFGAAAEALGVSRRALERLRVDFPEVFAAGKKSKKSS